MTLNDVMAVILRHFTEFVSLRGALSKRGWLKISSQKSSCSLSHLLMSFLFHFVSL